MLPPVPFTAQDTVQATNAAAVLTFNPAGASKCHVIGGVLVSYSAAPTGGNLQIADGSNVVFNVDITAGGPAPFYFFPFRVGSPNTALKITLAAGGSGIIGKITVLDRFVTSQQQVGLNVSSWFQIGIPAAYTHSTAFVYTVTQCTTGGSINVGYTGTVHFTTTDTSTAVFLPADTTLTSGQGTFTATLVTTGNQSITATDKTDSQDTGTSILVNVT